MLHSLYNIILYKSPVIHLCGTLLRSYLDKLENHIVRALEWLEKKIKPQDKIA